MSPLGRGDLAEIRRVPPGPACLAFGATGLAALLAAVILLAVGRPGTSLVLLPVSLVAVSVSTAIWARRRAAAGPAPLAAPAPAPAQA